MVDVFVADSIHGSSGDRTALVSYFIGIVLFVVYFWVEDSKSMTSVTHLVKRVV